MIGSTQVVHDKHDRFVLYKVFDSGRLSWEVIIWAEVFGRPREFSILG